MSGIFKIYYLLLLCLTCPGLSLFAQTRNVLSYVNPLIGTTKTKINAVWGGEGGTYPGSVAPSGFIQLTPETRNAEPKGYDYNDSSILYFSCLHHLSGYPNGSSGSIRIMPVEADKDFEQSKYSRTFSHHDEKSEPGYYKVLFRDNQTSVEMTSSERVGMFRILLPSKQKNMLFLGDAGNLEVVSKRIIKASERNALVLFNQDFAEFKKVNGGCIITFSSSTEVNELILKIATSSVSYDNTRLNINTEAEGWNFDQYRKQNQQKWVNALSTIEVEDTSEVNKTIFYTALYHSLLIPWIISDVDGSYRGANKLIHRAKGKNQYAAFSPWDTFRTLHPLLCLVAPEKQNDIILSMLDQFEQKGVLPKGPMTGNHVIPIIVDSYLKGIRGFDPALAYRAMNSTLAAAEETPDFSAYKKQGYVPSMYSESVTQTVEYAYNDWALAQFAGQVMNKAADSKSILERSFNYRNLFHSPSIFLLPRNENEFLLEPGNRGYKEGDKWSYSMFVPHNPRDLINLRGGDVDFATKLDSALSGQYIVFDNEPVLHVPYLFNYSNHPNLTQKWVRNIMNSHYKASPDGIPGNDDLGSMSSWYVFSAMGFFPVCPGRPLYDLGSPIFGKVTIHLPNEKKFIINTENNSSENHFVRSISLDKSEHRKTWISHATIVDGGEISFILDKDSGHVSYFGLDSAAPSETKMSSDFQVSDFHTELKKVLPDQSFSINFSVHNRGSKGTKIVRLYVDGKEYSRKNLFLDENSTVTDSMECRLYPVGKRYARIDNLNEAVVEVIRPDASQNAAIKVTELKCGMIRKKDEPLEFNLTVKNKGGFAEKAIVTVLVDNQPYEELVLYLEPGQIKRITSQVIFKSAGFHQLIVGAKQKQIKIYSTNSDSKVIDLATKAIGNTIPDWSGLSNPGILKRSKGNESSSGFIKTGASSFVEINYSESLDNFGEKITLMAWVYPTGRESISDILSKGDFIVMQTKDNKTLTFFAGGWGRGACTVPLPENWIGNWRHIAGVSDGNFLKIFIDGIESGKLTINSPANLSTRAKWMIGRNEEFPDKRFFNGYVDQFKVFVEPLTGSEIKIEMNASRPCTEL
ncbi:MAG: GH92 family glycosyl hydrolase [Prolixibacteraceae bacterium]|nr:GH92 family glycosyl hydrolase [Prolixibacteraceae bacterium]